MGGVWLPYLTIEIAAYIRQCSVPYICGIIEDIVNMD